MVIINTYIVSLEKGKKVIDFFSNKNIELPQIIGVNGRGLTAYEYFNYIKNDKNNYMTPGEVGCSLSHLAIYNSIKMFDVPGDYSLVLEDDAILPDDFLERLSSLKDAPYDILILGAQDSTVDRHYLWGEQDELGVYKINNLYAKRIWSTCAYLIKGKAASSISAEQSTKLNRADGWGLWSKSIGLNIGFINIVSHPLERTSSVIEEERLSVDRYKAFRASTFVAFVRTIRYSFYSCVGFFTGKAKIYPSGKNFLFESID